MRWKSFGVGGKVESLLSWPSAERGCLASGFLWVSSSLPALPSTPRPRARCRGLWTPRRRTRGATVVAPSSRRRARPPCSSGPGGPCLLVRVPRSLLFPRLPQALQPCSAGLGSAHARRKGQPPAPGAARSWGTSDAAGPALPRGLPSPAALLLQWGGGAHSRLKHLT